MTVEKPLLREIDPTWEAVRRDAEALQKSEPLMAGLIHSVVLDHESLTDALSFRLAQKLAGDEMPALALRSVYTAAFREAPELMDYVRADLSAVFERDPACDSYLQPILYFKAFWAIENHRIAHWYWTEGRQDLARFLQMRATECFSVDIHPGARLGRGLMIDHATGIVIGETAVVGDNVSMLHAVTLGGTGKEQGDRHPKIGNSVLIGAGAKILGNISVGDCSRVGAGSVVLHNVPARKTVAGVPARIVGDAGCPHPALSMDHLIRDTD